MPITKNSTTTPDNAISELCSLIARRRSPPFEDCENCVNELADLASFPFQVMSALTKLSTTQLPLMP
jgi:hypothetical protein